MGPLAQHQPTAQLPRRPCRHRVRSCVLRCQADRPNPGRKSNSRESPSDPVRFNPRHRPQPGGLGPGTQRRLAGHRVIATRHCRVRILRTPTRTDQPAGLRPRCRRHLDALGESRPVHVVGNSLQAREPSASNCWPRIRPGRQPGADQQRGVGSEVTLLLRMLAMPVIGPLSTRKTTGPAPPAGAHHLRDRSLATRQRVDHALAIGGATAQRRGDAETAVELATGRGSAAGDGRREIRDGRSPEPGGPP